MNLAIKYGSLKPWQMNRKLVLTLAVVAVLGGGVWRSHFQSKPSYRYPFEPIAQIEAVGRLEAEIEFSRGRIRQQPEDGLERAALAGAYLKMARATGENAWYLLAERSARESLAQLPFDNSGAVLVLARIAEAQHDFDEAIRLASGVLEERPQDENALALLVTAYLAKGEVAKADGAAQRLSSQIPTLGSLMLQALVDVAKGDNEGAIEHFQRAMAAEEPGETGSSAQLRTRFARFYFDRGNPAKARQLYGEALRIVPQYPPALIGLAKLETRLGRYKAADRLYTQVFPFPDAPNSLGTLALVGRAQIETLQGNDAQAEKLWMQAERLLRQELDGEEFGHRRDLAYLLLARGNGEDVPAALALMEEEAIVRRDAETLDTLAWALSASGRWEEAKSIAREALASNPRHAKLLYRLGSIEQALGNRSVADAYFASAAQIDPTFDDRARSLLGMSLAMAGDRHLTLSAGGF